MKPHQLIGLPYRLGADPIKHHAVDCVSLARTVLKHYGINFPEPTRDWYRRFLKKDYKIFKEELQRWGNETKQFNIGTVALCKSNNGFGLAVYYEEGWIKLRRVGGEMESFKRPGGRRVYSRRSRIM